MQAETLSERERPRGASGRRPLVDFIVIGAMRAGTTMLHDLLSGHPQISMARMKETDFFVAEKNLPRGTGWYGAQFDPARPIRGEISPNYAKAMDFPGVPERIFEHCPGVRLVYVLRDPVARAVSQYAHSWNMGELSDTPEQMARSPEYPRILDASRYARQIDNYLRLFDPGQLLVVDFDALLAEVVDTEGADPEHIEDVLDSPAVPLRQLGAESRGLVPVLAGEALLEDLGAHELVVEVAVDVVGVLRQNSCQDPVQQREHLPVGNAHALGRRFVAVFGLLLVDGHDCLHE